MHIKPGSTLLHPPKNLENMRGRSYGFFWWVDHYFQHYLTSIFSHNGFVFEGRDAKRLVILKGDFESGEEKGGGQLKEEIARKYSAYFQSILHHNNGYFLTASASLSYSEAMRWKTKAQRIDCSSSK